MPILGDFEVYIQQESALQAGRWYDLTESESADTLREGAANATRLTKVVDAGPGKFRFRIVVREDVAWGVYNGLVIQLTIDEGEKVHEYEVLVYKPGEAHRKIAVNGKVEQMTEANAAGRAAYVLDKILIPPMRGSKEWDYHEFVFQKLDFDGCDQIEHLQKAGPNDDQQYRTTRGSLGKIEVDIKLVTIRKSHRQLKLPYDPKVLDSEQLARSKSEAVEQGLTLCTDLHIIPLEIDEEWSEQRCSVDKRTGPKHTFVLLYREPGTYHKFDDSDIEIVDETRRATTKHSRQPEVLNASTMAPSGLNEADDTSDEEPGSENRSVSMETEESADRLPVQGSLATNSRESQHAVPCAVSQPSQPTALPQGSLAESDAESGDGMSHEMSHEVNNECDNLDVKQEDLREEVSNSTDSSFSERLDGPDPFDAAPSINRISDLYHVAKENHRSRIEEMNSKILQLEHDKEENDTKLSQLRDAQGQTSDLIQQVTTHIESLNLQKISLEQDKQELEDREAELLETDGNLHDEIEELRTRISNITPQKPETLIAFEKHLEHESARQHRIRDDNNKKRRRGDRASTDSSQSRRDQEYGKRRDTSDKENVP